MKHRPILDLKTANMTTNTDEFPVDRVKLENDKHALSKELIFTQDEQLYTVVFSNNDAFSACIGKYYAINLSCEICGRLYPNLPMMGVPVFDTQTVRVSTHDKPILTVQMEGVFCSFECTYLALSYIHKNIIRFDQKNPIYFNSFSILNMLFKLCYSDEPLPWISSEKYTVDNYKPFVHDSLPNVVLLPLKLSRKEMIKK